jgi:disulfide bond formation protein DsbB
MGGTDDLGNQSAADMTPLAGFALIVGGSLGNILDRLRKGAVADFLDIFWRDWHWPAFNLADMAIVCGVGLVLASQGASAQTGDPPMADRLTPSAERALTVAFLLALAAALGALFIGEVLGQAPCRLCWYQRIAMFPLAPILGVALWRGDPAGRVYALPLVVAGIAAALWHSGLYAGVIPETALLCAKDGPACIDKAGQAILGLPLPYLSLADFAAIGLCLLDVKGSRP